MENSSLRPFYNLVATLISLLGIALVSSGMFDLKTAAEFSQHSTDNLTLPPNFAFSIWGVIYFGFLLYSIYQFFPGQSDNPRIRRAELYVTLSILLNFAWVLLIGMGFVVLPYLMLWLMLIISLFLLFTYGTPHVNRPLTERIIFGCFAIYAGWLTVALIPFTTDLLIQTGWRGKPLTPTLIAIAVYLFVILIFYGAYRELKHTWYLFPLVWTLVSLSIKFTGTLSLTAGGLALLVAIYFVYKLAQSVTMAEQSYINDLNRTH